jgi:hypothetical protein
MNGSPTFDAFISYSRADQLFANRLKTALESYKAPKGLGLPERHLKIFRDQSDFTGVDYFTSIGKHLAESRSLILVCSPNARRSQYVDDEIRRFVQSRADGRVIPVLCAGIPNNENGPRGCGCIQSGRRIRSSPDGSRVATLASSGSVRLFNLERFTPVSELVTLAAQRVKRDWTPGERERFLHQKPE